MKTFLRTTLFWLVAGATFLIVSGFGYGNRRITPVFDQLYLVERLPTPVVQYIEGQGRERAINEQTAMENSSTELPQPTLDDPALYIETDGISDITTLPASRPQNFPQPSTTELLNGQANLSQQMNEQFIQLSQQLQNLVSLCQKNGLPSGSLGNEEGGVNEVDEAMQKINEVAQKKAELQAQIDALKLEMETLTI